jgi:hypothetical protein
MIRSRVHAGEFQASCPDAEIPIETGQAAAESWRPESDVSGTYTYRDTLML